MKETKYQRLMRQRREARRRYEDGHKEQRAKAKRKARKGKR
jgi:hypothetical protein